MSLINVEEPSTKIKKLAFICAKCFKEKADKLAWFSD